MPYRNEQLKTPALIRRAAGLLAILLAGCVIFSGSFGLTAFAQNAGDRQDITGMCSAYVRKELLRDSGENGERAKEFAPVILATAVSSYQQNNSSVKNAKKACDYVNGTVVRPGEEFSFNETIGERTRANGYVNAPSIAGDRLEMTVGGGICQISSMLYNVSLRSGMRIRERHAHSLAVPYASNGFDASVVWGQWDYRFTNPYESSVAILAGYDDEKEEIRIYLISNRGDILDGYSYALRYRQTGNYTYHNFVDVYKDGTPVETKDLGINRYYGETGTSLRN